MPSKDTTAQLYLNDVPVGTIQLKGMRSGWGLGEFSPNDRFSKFAIAFGRWSLLMHADYDRTGLSEAALDELRHAECAIDAIRARLFLDQSQQWRPLTQVNIDGRLIEWKEGWG